MLIKIALFVFAIVGFTSSSPLSESELSKMLQQPAVGERNTPLEQTILDILESLREVMVTGADGIPILDPLGINRLHLDGETVGLDNTHVTIESLTLKHLSTFEIDSLSLTRTSLLPLRYTLEIEGNIPVIDVAIANYDLNVEVLGSNVFGNGNGSVIIREPRIKATVVVAPSIRIGAIYINIVSSDVQFSLSEFEPLVNGLFGNPGASEFANLFIKNLIPALLDFYEAEIALFLSNTVVEVGNEILGDINLIDILG